MNVTVEIERFEEEYYARFIRIKDGDKTALVFYHDKTDLEWAYELADLLGEKRNTAVTWETND